jgi:DNA (cytosine-5)-methyltransferase 1
VKTALDLFCGAGGASMGLHRAGFNVIGVDIHPQPNYPFRFIQANALDALAGMDPFDLIWASPPCQHYCSFSRNLGTAHNHPDLIEPVRRMLIDSRKPWVIENVVGAPLKHAFMLCGTMFGLPILRHRLFETSWRMDFGPADCAHKGNEIPVYGNGTSVWHLKKRGGVGVSVAEKKSAMGIDWMTGDELRESIPPAYSEFIGRAALEAM